MSGNLLNQPFLSDYSMSIKKPKVEHLDSMGCYIGNSHFVGDAELNLLENYKSSMISFNYLGNLTYLEIKCFNMHL